MLTLAEIAYAARGLLLLARFDVRGFEYFDRSIQGFWRSFQVAVLVAPIHALAIGTYLPELEPKAPWQQILLAVICLYVIAWFLYPVVTYEICRATGKMEDYVGYIAVYNWLGFAVAFLQFLVLIPAVVGLWPPQTSASISHFMFYALLPFAWFIARHGLAIAAMPAVGLVFIDFILTDVIAATLAYFVK
jgi:hypothetical protein